jgi:NADPH:quinone reductase-like Zn-dependent oxidoreductase
MESFFTIPDTPGYTAVEEIVEAGRDVMDLRPGDMVFTLGPHAEYYNFDTRERWHGICIRLPEEIDPVVFLSH